MCRTGALEDFSLKKLCLSDLKNFRQFFYRYTQTPAERTCKKTMDHKDFCYYQNRSPAYTVHCLVKAFYTSSDVCTWRFCVLVDPGEKGVWLLGTMVEGLIQVGWQPFTYILLYMCKRVVQISLLPRKLLWMFV